MSVRDFAKYGYLFLKHGNWDGQQIVPEAWVQASTETDPTVRMWPIYAYLWHTNFPMLFRGKGDHIPADAYMAEGVLGQNIFVFPSQGLVVVKVANSRGLHPDPDQLRLLTLLLDAIQEDDGASTTE
jgi:CubicO group peptidase (beta-lactamase class C family)